MKTKTMHDKELNSRAYFRERERERERERGREREGERETMYWVVG